MITALIDYHIEVAASTLKLRISFDKPYSIQYNEIANIKTSLNAGGFSSRYSGNIQKGIDASSPVESIGKLATTWETLKKQPV